MPGKLKDDNKTGIHLKHIHQIQSNFLFSNVCTSTVFTCFWFQDVLPFTEPFCQMLPR